MATKDKNRIRRFHLGGWLLFVACALFFIAAGLKNRDVLTLIGSILFLIACFCFIVPLVEENNGTREHL